ncbi:MAG: M67 family metallopeptidase [Termitinemataceae bacterium]|nr:MAG: M67 family metallopeptidase [Termitinemataceae bacterium]
MIVLDGTTRADINAEGQKTYPNECCGFLFEETESGAEGLEVEGRKVIKKILSAWNSQAGEEQYHRFEIKPQQMMMAEKTAIELKLDLLGFYHSHPDHPSAPSEYDRVNALPFYSYIIVSVNKGKSDLMTSWELDGETRMFNREEIKDIEEEERGN